MLKIRPYVSKEDAKIFADIHYRSVHDLDFVYYSQEILDNWSSVVDEKRIQQIITTEDEEMRVIAEWNGKPVGLGCVVPKLSELRGCYVRGNYNNKGIGKAVIQALEEIAIENGCLSLSLDSSLNAYEFYKKCGYDMIEKSFHTLPSGAKIECYKMIKSFETSPLRVKDDNDQ